MKSAVSQQIHYYDDGSGCCVPDERSCCDPEGIESVLVNAYSKLNYLADLEIREKCYGHECSDNISDSVEEITDLIDLAERELKKVRSGRKPCLKCEDLNKVKENLTSLVGTNCGITYNYQEVDESGIEEWIFNNPLCVSYESWNKWSKILVRKLEVNLTSKIDEAKLVLEISRKDLTPDMLVALSVARETKNLKLTIDRTIEESKIDFELLREKTPSFDLELKTYLKLVENNLSFDIVKTIYDNGAELHIDRVDNKDKIMLHTTLSKYCIDDLDFNIDYIKKVTQEACNIDEAALKANYK